MYNHLSEIDSMFWCWSTDLKRRIQFFFLLMVWTYSLKIILYICQKLNLNFHDV